MSDTDTTTTDDSTDTDTDSDPPLVFEVYTDSTGEWRWRATQPDPDDHIICDSGEGYPTRQHARHAVERMRTFAEQAVVTELVETRRGRSFRQDITIEMDGGDVE